MNKQTKSNKTLFNIHHKMKSIRACIHIKECRSTVYIHLGSANFQRPLSLQIKLPTEAKGRRPWDKSRITLYPIRFILVDMEGNII